MYRVKIYISKLGLARFPMTAKILQGGVMVTNRRIGS